MFAGEGGQDSRLFLKDLAAAYFRYCQKLNLTATVLDETDSSLTFRVDGREAFEAFKHEGGKHCVQRVPPTESKGRRHTSFISIAVLEVPEEIDTSLNEKEVELTTTRGGGPGGQAINKLENTAVAVHKPSGIRVRIQTRSQHTSKQMALNILAVKVADHFRSAAHQKTNANRREQLGDGSRSGKVRTYNFIESYVADHKMGTRTAKIKDVMKGNFDLLWP